MYAWQAWLSRPGVQGAVRTGTSRDRHVQYSSTCPPQGWLLSSSGTWSASCNCCCDPGGLLCLNVSCCIVLDFQRTQLSLYLVILIAVVCGAVVFLIIFLIVCIRKPKDGEQNVLENLECVVHAQLGFTSEGFWGWGWHSAHSYPQQLWHLHRTGSHGSKQVVEDLKRQRSPFLLRESQLQQLGRAALIPMPGPGDLGLCPLGHPAALCSAAGVSLCSPRTPVALKLTARPSLLIRSSKVAGDELILSCYFQIPVCTSCCLVFPLVPGGKGVIINSPCSIWINFLSSLQTQDIFTEFFCLFCTNTRKLLTKRFLRVSLITLGSVQRTHWGFGLGFFNTDGRSFLLVPLFLLITCLQLLQLCAAINNNCYQILLLPFFLKESRITSF